MQTSVFINALFRQPFRVAEILTLKILVQRLYSYKIRRYGIKARAHGYEALLLGTDPNLLKTCRVPAQTPLELFTENLAKMQCQGP